LFDHNASSSLFSLPTKSALQLSPVIVASVANMARSVHDEVHAAPEIKNDSANVERVLSTDEKLDHINYDRIDDEIAKYANAEAIEMSPEENQRLKRMIDRRVLPIMVFTYFLQALDKGTMSFASIMGIMDDIPALKQGSNVWLEQDHRDPEI
jgi:hypothetical protein